jgi:hypothetical protein
MGDLAQAETYLQRNLSLIQEARTSGLPGWRTAYAVITSLGKPTLSFTVRLFSRRADSSLMPKPLLTQSGHWTRVQLDNFAV